MFKLTTPDGYVAWINTEYFQAIIQQNGGLPDGWSYEVVDD